MKQPFPFLSSSEGDCIVFQWDSKLLEKDAAMSSSLTEQPETLDSSDFIFFLPLFQWSRVLVFQALCIRDVREEFSIDK